MKNKIIIAATMLSFVTLAQNSSFELYTGTNTKYYSVADFFRNYPKSDVNYGVKLDVDLYKNMYRFGGKFENQTSFKPFKLNKDTITTAKPNIFIKYIMPEKNNTNFDVKLSANFSNKVIKDKNKYKLYNGDNKVTEYKAEDYSKYTLNKIDGSNKTSLELNSSKFNSDNPPYVKNENGKCDLESPLLANAGDAVNCKLDIDKIEKPINDINIDEKVYMNTFKLESNMSTVINDMYKLNGSFLAQIDAKNSDKSLNPYAKLSLNLKREDFKLNDNTMSSLDFNFNIDNKFEKLNAGFDNIYLSGKMSFVNDIKLPKTILLGELMSNTNISKLSYSKPKADIELAKKVLYDKTEDANYEILTDFYKNLYLGALTANDNYDTTASEYNLDYVAGKLGKLYSDKLSELKDSVGNLENYGQYTGVGFEVYNTTLNNFEFSGNLKFGHAYTINPTTLGSNGQLLTEKTNKIIPEINFGVKYTGFKNANLNANVGLVYEYTKSNLSDKNTNGLKFNFGAHADYTKVLKEDKLSLISKIDINLVGVGIHNTKSESKENKFPLFYGLDIKPELELVYTPVQNLNLNTSLSYTRSYIQSYTDSTFNLIPSKFGINLGLQYQW